MRTHVKVLAWLHVAFGIIGILMGLTALIFFGGLATVVNLTDHSSDGEIGSLVLGGVGGIAFLVLLLLSLPMIVAGIGLLNFRPWARILAAVLSVLNIFNFPFGTALGVYGLWVLFSPEGSALFAPERSPAPI